MASGTPKDFNIAAIGDVQVSDQEELGFAAKSIFSELLERNDIDFNLVLGDLVNSNMDILPDFGAMLNTHSCHQIGRAHV